MRSHLSFPGDGRPRCRWGPSQVVKGTVRRILAALGATFPATVAAMVTGVGTTTMSGVAAAQPAEIRSLLEAPGIRLVLIRAPGREFDWRDFPQPPGLHYRVLTSCPRGVPADDFCDRHSQWQHSLQLEAGEAVAWTWQGRRVLFKTGPELARQAIGTHLGPLPRVWIDTASRRRRRATATALRATGRWRPTHRIQDIERLRTLTGVETAARCPDKHPPSLGLLRISEQQATWFDPDRNCASVTVPAGGSGADIVARLMDAWREAPTGPLGPSPASDSRIERAPPSAGGQSLGRLVDAHLQEAINESHAVLDRLIDGGGDRRLLETVRDWLGVRYLRDGDDTAGIDDFNLMRALNEQVYGIELEGEAIDWLQVYEKVSVDESRPEATVRPGDLLFKVTLSYRPREVLLYIGGGKVVTSKDIKGVLVFDVPRDLPVKYYLVARRPSRLLGQR